MSGRGVHARWAVTAACLLALAAARAAVASSRHAGIEAQLDAMMVAANHHDTDEFLKPFLHGPGLVFVFNGQVIRGWQALHAAQSKWWRNGASDARYSQSSPTRFTDLSPGVVITTQQLESRRTGPGGKRQSAVFAVSSVWRHLRGGWRIVYACESWAP